MIKKCLSVFACQFGFLLLMAVGQSASGFAADAAPPACPATAEAGKKALSELSKNMIKKRHELKDSMFRVVELNGKASGSNSDELKSAAQNRKRVQAEMIGYYRSYLSLLKCRKPASTQNTSHAAR